MRCFVVICTLLVWVHANQVSYEGYKVFRIYPINESQLSLLAGLRNNADVDFWSSLRHHAKHVDVMVAPKTQQMFTGYLQKHGIQFIEHINNVEKVVQRDRFLQLIARSNNLNGRIGFTKYNRFYEINNYLDQLAQNYPQIVKVRSIGRSYNSRNMKLIQISTNPAANKPVIFVDCGIHAREWIAPAMGLYIIQQLVENHANIDLLDKVDWHILPVMNPDGYEYSHTIARLWRKTRSPQGIFCYGTDANRNFGFHWGEVGASSNRCAEDYKGSKAFSEIETRNVRDYILSNKNRIKLYLTFHSYGNYLLYPWGYTSDLPADDAELKSLAEAVNGTIVSAGGDPYEIGTSTNVLYPAAGGSDDWAKGVAGIQLSYTIELPGGGSSGFDPPPSSILPIVTKTFPGVRVYGEYIANKFG